MVYRDARYVDETRVSLIHTATSDREDRHATD
ncbi:hypothetical protein JMJ77_0007942, partial [Colletotrichum scovillei]